MAKTRSCASFSHEISIAFLDRPITKPLSERGDRTHTCIAPGSKTRSQSDAGPGGSPGAGAPAIGRLPGPRGSVGPLWSFTISQIIMPGNGGGSGGAWLLFAVRPVPASSPGGKFFPIPWSCAGRWGAAAWPKTPDPGDVARERLVLATGKNFPSIAFTSARAYTVI